MDESFTLARFALSLVAAFAARAINYNRKPGVQRLAVRFAALRDRKRPWPEALARAFASRIVVIGAIKGNAGTRAAF